jgi:hypothetical protein
VSLERLGQLLERQQALPPNLHRLVHVALHPREPLLGGDQLRLPVRRVGRLDSPMAC